MGKKYPGINNITQPVFDVITKKVNEDIENGKINISKGTKLYKHKISGFGPTLLGGVDELISTNNTPITDFSTLKQIFDSRISGFKNNIDGYSIPIGLFNDTEKYYGYFIIQSIMSMPQFSSAAIPHEYFNVSDTVTEL